MLVTLKCVRQFIRHWFLFTLQDATTAAFGWAAIPGAALLFAIIKAKFPKFVVNNVSSTLLYAAGGAAAAWVIAFLGIAIFRSPIRAYFMLKPLKVTTNYRRQPPAARTGYQTDQASVLIRNRSAEHLLDCAVRITQIEEVSTGYLFEHDKLPRFVQGFDLPSKSTRYATLAYWTTREPPREDDSGINIAGPAAAGYYNGNVMRLPVSDYELRISITVPGSHTETANCRVWIDDRHLKARLSSNVPRECRRAG